MSDRRRTFGVAGLLAIGARRPHDHSVNPSDGSVLISELIVDTGGVIATVTGSYQWLPITSFER